MLATRLQQIYRDRRNALERFVFRFLRNSDDAADVAQEAFLRLYTAELGGQTPASEALLYTIARNLALSELRKRTSRAIDEGCDIEDMALADPRPNPEIALQQRQMVSAIEAGMENMPPRCLEAFRLRKVEGLSQADIAKRMGISPKTVERHITQAIQICHQSLIDKQQRHGSRQAGKNL